jgi:L-ascorbate metabolism protein UlaG (beta-lactamase superfamily)
MPQGSIISVGLLTCALALISCVRPETGQSSSWPTDTQAPVTLTYLGVAGWRVVDGSHTLLVDPYFSRVDAQDGVVLSPDQDAIAKYAPAHADVILVGHSHYDHLLDVPTIARATGATVVGTESTLNVVRAAGLPERSLVLAQGGETFELGPFSVHAIRGLHSLTGHASAAIPHNVTLPMTADGYAEGSTLQYLVRVSGHAILFIGSANFIEGEVEGLRPDIAVVAVGLREKIPDYSCRLMRALGRPPLVLTNHFDANRKPLGSSQTDIGDEGRADLVRFADEIHTCAPTTKVVVPTHFQPIAL